MKTLFTVLSCDCDHDRKRFNVKIGDNEPCWEGYIRLGSFFDHIRNRVQTETGLVPALTLHIRSDKLVKAYCGSYDYCFEIYEKDLSRWFCDLDEVAWHHHQYRVKDNRWFHEFDDEHYIVQHIHEAFEAIRARKLHTVHSGTNFQNTASMNAFNDIGIRSDCSGMPRMWSQGSYNRYDYQRLKPNRLYVPSRLDYQQPDLKHENGIVEVPVTTVCHPLFRYIGFLNLVVKRQKLQKDLLRAKYSFVQITAHPSMFKSFISRILNEYRDLEYYSTYFHADELLPDCLKDKKTRFFYKQSYIIENLRYLVEIARRNNRTIEFVNVRRLCSFFGVEEKAPSLLLPS